MSEIGEISTDDQFRFELRDVRHDLEHVTQERDDAVASNMRLVKHIKRANEQAKRCGEYAMTVGEYRDEAWAERDRLRVQVRELERQRDQVLAYVATLECSNCEHVHEEGWCNFAYEGGGNCGCGWGPPQVTKDIRDLLKEA